MNFRVYFILVLAGLSGCKSMNRFDSASPGMSAEDVLQVFGAPDRVQKIMHYEIWSYPEINSKQCQFFMIKNELTQPVKCYFHPVQTAQGLTSSKK